LKLGRIGSILLGIWLILKGVPYFVDIKIDGMIMAVLAIVTGMANKEHFGVLFLTVSCHLNLNRLAFSLPLWHT